MAKKPKEITRQFKTIKKKDGTEYEKPVGTTTANPGPTVSPTSTM